MIRVAIVEDEIDPLLQLACRVCLIGAGSQHAGTPPGVEGHHRMVVLPFILGVEAAAENGIGSRISALEKTLAEEDCSVSIPDVDYSLGHLDPSNEADREAIVSGLAARNVDVVICDSNMGDKYAGAHLWNIAAARKLSWHFLLVTHHDDVMKEYRETEFPQFRHIDPCVFTPKSDILQEPWSHRHPDLVALIGKATAQQVPAASIAPGGRFGPDLVGASAAMMKIFEAIERNATSYLNILLIGPTGTGKELVAREMHRRANRQSRSGAPAEFLPLDCGTLKSTFESELSGVGPGSFTQVAAKPGIFEVADGGTVFLDEVHNLTWDAQAHLLRIIQDTPVDQHRPRSRAGWPQRNVRSVRRTGTTTEIPVFFRLICGTNQDLAELVAEGKFRHDLFHRISGMTIELPPLADRKEDVGLIADIYLNDKYSMRLSPGARGLLSSYEWPGNVRQLINVLEQAHLRADSSLIEKTNPAFDFLVNTAAISDERTKHPVDVIPDDWTPLSDEKIIDFIVTHKLRKTPEQLRERIRMKGTDEPDYARVCLIIHRVMQHVLVDNKPGGERLLSFKQRVAPEYFGGVRYESLKNDPSDRGLTETILSRCPYPQCQKKPRKTSTAVA